MAANLYLNKGYAGRQSAWHRSGEVLPNAESIGELLIAAGGDFKYELMPIFWEKEDTSGELWAIQESNKRIVTINGETSLGHIVSDGYTFHQPAELATAMDNILKASKTWGGQDWKPETVVILGKGETTCYCISLGGVNIGKTECRDFLIATDTVDGKHSLTGAIVTEKVVCRNTLEIALKGAKVNLAIRHSVGHRDVFQSAVESIIKSRGYIHEVMNQLAEEAVTDRQVNEYLNKLFEVPEKEDNKYSPTVAKKMMALQLNAQGNFHRMVEQEKEVATKWVLFNAGQEAIEHSGLISSERVTIKSLLTGRGEVVERITQAFVLVNAL